MTRNIKRIIGLILVLVLSCSILPGCSRSSTEAAGQDAFNYLRVDNMQSKDILSIIEELTSDKYKGRLAGEEGNTMSAKYIADYFKKLGLSNPEGLENYMQYYDQPTIELVEKPELQIVDKLGKTVTDLQYPENFVLRSLSSSTDRIDLQSPLYIVEQISQLSEGNSELKGKILLVPWNVRSDMNMYNMIDTAYASGASAIIAEYDVSDISDYKYLPITPMVGPWLSKEYNPFINVDNDSFAALVEAAKLGNQVHYKCSYNMNISAKVPNVVGLIPGSDQKLKNEYIIIGAHYDHVGDNMDGTYNPGALDNASGTSAMIEIAKVLKENNIAPKRSILFIAFNGEEGGLLGSTYYSEHPIYPLDKAVMINLDMVGSADKVPLTIAAAENSDVSLRNTLFEYANILGIDNEKGYESASDHAGFAEQGVPSACLINLEFRYGYHSPNDTIADVDGDRVKEIIKLVLYYIDKQAF